MGKLKKRRLPVATLEMLEGRIAPAMFLVTSLADTSAPGTLRSEITAADAANNGNDSIVIKTGLTGTIKLTSDLPSITDGVTITGPTKNRSSLVINGEGHDIF